LYLQDYSVQVTDPNNNPVTNSTVTLRVRPVAFSLGRGCQIAADATIPTSAATYCTEDFDGNGNLDAGKDGVRILTTTQTAGSCPATVAAANAVTAPLNVGLTLPGTVNVLLTPQNSVAGSVPASITTDSSGIAAFTLTYLKASAIWVVDKITATISVNGTESTASTIFQLPVTTADVTLPGTCHISDSPFSY
jgi:hypothetical protein